MKIAGTLANYSMADADGLRKAMGKKIATMMAMHRDLFMKGARENNIPVDKAKNIFDLMEKFGGYGFNKSHSAAYAIIAFQTAYLKTHFPIEFMAALLTSEMGNSDSVVKFIAECRSHDIEVLPPDINESGTTFMVNGSRIRFGLVAVKNVGEVAIESIIEARKEGRFSSLFDFFERVESRKVNKRVVESLITCGAFDSTGDNRSQMLAVLDDAIDFGQRTQKERNDPQMSLFDMGDDKQVTLNAPSMPEMDEWDEKQLLALEKEALGFYITGHPLQKYEDILEKFTNANTISIKEKNNGEAVRIGGTIKSTKIIRTKKGDLMAFAEIEDMGGSVETVIFSSVYAVVSDLLINDNPVLIQGKLQKEENSVKILADTIIPMDKAEETWTASIHIHLDSARVEKNMLIELREALQKYPGSCQTYLCIQIPDQSETILALPDTMKLMAGVAMLRDVNRILGYKAVNTVCSKAVVDSNSNGSNRNNRRRKYVNA